MTQPMKDNGRMADMLSEAASRRVKHPLPAPTSCPNCQSPVEIRCREGDLQERYGVWPWFYACTQCDAEIGMHPGTTIPLGFMADARTRALRHKARLSLKTLYLTGMMSHREARRRLSHCSGIPLNYCHFDWLESMEAFEAPEFIQELYVREVTELLQPVLDPAIGPELRQHLRRLRRMAADDDVQLDRWEPEDLALARHGQLTTENRFEIAETRDAFLAALPDCLRADYGYLKQALSLDEDLSDTDDPEKAINIMEQAWSEFGLALFEYRRDEIRQRFATAMPELWAED